MKLTAIFIVWEDMNDLPNNGYGGHFISHNEAKIFKIEL